MAIPAVSAPKAEDTVFKIDDLLIDWRQAAYFNSAPCLFLIARHNATLINALFKLYRLLGHGLLSPFEWVQ